MAHRRVYSPRRLRLVLVLLSLVTLPAVLGSAVLVYYYMRFSTLVEKRLHGERWQAPSRLYARPQVLKPGTSLTSEELVRSLNSLKYEQRDGGLHAPGEFALRDNGVVALFPRAVPGGASEVLLASFTDKGLKDLRGEKTKRAYAEQPLEPELITCLFDDATREKRRRVTFQELPDLLVKAVLAIEDRRFFSHPGLDPIGIVSAALKNIQAESWVRGGSTITQQLVKNFFLTPERTFKRKAAEAMLAFVIERRASKQEILELYLNEVYLGQVGSFSINGMGQGARMYFHKDVGNLTLTEAALLAGMIQSPNPYNPYRHPQRATERRALVLQAMREEGYITEAQAKEAIAAPLGVESPAADSAEAPSYVDLVRTLLAQRYDPRDLATQNLQVYTSLDLHLQAAAQRAVQHGIEKLDKQIKRKASGPVQVCLIALQPRTGAVVALVGGRSYASTQYNRVSQARRQPGSTFKPFVYLTAFEATFDDQALPPITPATVVDDSPTPFFYENKEYIPQNYEDKYYGLVTLHEALTHSLNVATVKVAELIGFDRVARMWNDTLGMKTGIKPYPALALGSFEATPMEMATAYTVLANNGLKVDPLSVLKVVDEKGNTLEHHAPEPRQVVRPESAFLVTNMLRGTLNTGTAAAARAWGFSADAAGKTGTTNDLRDAWFDGFTPDLLCVVWVGFDDNTPINLSGATAALPIWVEFMKEAVQGQEPSFFKAPSENVVMVEIDPETGQVASSSCPKRVLEAFIIGTEPTEFCRKH